jgi:CHAT domain-containing protein
MVRKILFLASNPTDTGRLRLDKEIREIREGLKRSNERNQFELIQIFGVRVDDLRRSLLDHSPRIVHFAGHDGVDGIVLEDDRGLAFQVPNDALADLFDLCAQQIECVVLSACHSDPQAEAIARHIPYVIGMKAAVSDTAAIEFAVGFYDALGAGKSIEEAFRFGCNAIALKGIPEAVTPVLKKKELTAAERQHLECSYSPAPDVFVDVSVLNPDTTSWNRGEETVLRYAIDRNQERIKIYSDLGYSGRFTRGGPIEPLDYLTPTWCAFKWDFPILDFKILNNLTNPLFLTEVVLEVAESRIDSEPLFAIKKDTQQRNAGILQLINEDGCNLTDLTVSFHLLPGQIATPASFEPPFRHSLTLPILEDHAEIDVTQAFKEEGVDIDDLILLGNGKWDDNAYVLSKADGLEERLTEDEAQERWKKCLGHFTDEVGTLVGEICFTNIGDAGRKHIVKFHAPVYLANQKLYRITKPPTFMYDTAFEAKASAYQRRVQISQELQPGETDRFTIKVAVAKSSFHRFRATLIDISGLTLESLPIEMNCFVPRWRQKSVQNMISSQNKP